MHLTDDEALTAAQTLCESDTGQKWSQLEPTEQEAYIRIVRDLADHLTVHRSPEALRVFYRWMGRKE